MNRIKPFHIRRIRLIVSIACLIFLGCSFEVDFLIKLPEPTINRLRVEKDQIVIDIKLKLDTQTHSDFSNYIVLLGEEGDDLEDAFLEINQRTSLSQIPYFQGATAKPTFIANGVETLTHIITNRLSRGKNYQIAVMAFGQNDQYGKYKDSNGWIYSRLSPKAIFHRTYYTNGTLGVLTPGKDTYAGYIAQGDKIVFTNHTSTTDYELVFITNQENIYVTSGSGVEIRTLGDVDSFDEVIEIPNQGFRDGAELPVLEGHLIILKKRGRVHKIHIRKIDQEKLAESKIELDIIYTTVSGQEKL